MITTDNWRRHTNQAGDLFNAERSASVGNTALLRVIFILLGLWYLKIDLDALLRAPGKAFFACAAGGMRLRGGQACFAYAAGGQGPAAAPNNPRPGGVAQAPPFFG